MKILAVDDDPMVLDLLKGSLPPAGYPDVTTANSAAEAMEIVQNADRPFDCFLLDIQMPQMSGIELCDWIRYIPDYADVPILMVTAMSDKVFINQAFAAGASDYVTKPFDPLELTTRMRVAERLNQKSQDARHNGEMVQALLNDNFRGPKFNFDTPFTIRDVAGVIDRVALENFLLQLGRGGMFATNVFAFQIVNARTLYDSCSPEEYFYTITDVAEAISDSLTYGESFVAHAGRGAFVCVCHGSDQIDADELLMNVQQAIDKMELVYDDWREMDVQVSVSPAQRMGLRSGRAAIEALDSAIDKARRAASEAVHTSEFAGWKRDLIKAFAWAG
ncbi:response regulator [Thalassobius sp. S69A]|uniref:response regulator n=1 Tax=unclassified Thalassovita TaxID=2619711 RepID=UPI000C120B8A|nr:two-component system response regulator [Paracoccaceae bacterium]MBT26664.1 two-component system response regulator [Paracoccaceae bacterium]